MAALIVAGTDRDGNMEQRLVNMLEPAAYMMADAMLAEREKDR